MTPSRICSGESACARHDSGLYSADTLKMVVPLLFSADLNIQSKHMLSASLSARNEHGMWQLSPRLGSPVFELHATSHRQLHSSIEDAENFSDAIRHTRGHIQSLVDLFASPSCTESIGVLCNMTQFGNRVLGDGASLHRPRMLRGNARQKLQHVGEALFVAGASLPVITQNVDQRICFQFKSLLVDERCAAVGGSVSPWVTLLDVLRPDGHAHESLELTEEFAWRLVTALVGSVAFVHAQGLHYGGTLSCKDVIVRHHRDLGIPEFAVAPPFSLAGSSSQNPDDVLPEQASDVLAIGQVAASLLSSPHFLPNQAHSAAKSLPPFSTVSTDLSLLVRRMIVTADQRPSAPQFLDFQAIVLRIGGQLVSLVAEGGKQCLLQKQRELEENLALSQLRPAPAAAATDREAVLHAREMKLQSFLELYELTAATLDGMQINGHSVGALKAMLGAQRSSPSLSTSTHHLSTQGHHPPHTTQFASTQGRPTDNLYRPTAISAADASRLQDDHPRTPVEPTPAMPQRYGESSVVVQSTASTPPRASSSISRPSSSSAAWPAVMDVPSPLPKIEMSMDDSTPPQLMRRGLTPRQYSPPALPPPLLNDSIEVIVLEDEEPQHAAPSDASTTAAQSTRRRGHRQRNGNGIPGEIDGSVDDASGAVSQGAMAWRDHHFAELDFMQQELHRSSRTTPTKVNTGSSLQQKFAPQANRRSPSAGHRVTSKSRSSGASNNSLDRDDDPTVTLQRLRAEF